MSGYVYVLTNKSLRGLIKIGHTTKLPSKRASELSTTGLPTPFKVFDCIKVDEPEEVERRVHQKLSNMRIAKNREFFEIEPNEAMKIIKSVAGGVETWREILKEREKEKKEKQLIDKNLNTEWGVIFGNLVEEKKYRYFAKTHKILEIIIVILCISSFVGVFLYNFYESLDDNIFIFLFGIPIVAIIPLGLFYSLIEKLRDSRLKNIWNKAEKTMTEKHGDTWQSSNTRKKILSRGWYACK